VALGELQVVERLEVEVRPLTDLPQRDVVLVGLAVGRVGLGKVGEQGEQLVAALVELGELRLELLELRLERARGLAGLLKGRVVGLAGPGRLLDLRGELVLLGANPVDPRVQLAAALVDRDQLIELLRRPSSRQRRADGLRVGADLLEVERGPAPGGLRRGDGRLRGRRGGLGDILPRVLGDELRDLLRVVAHDDVLGHDRP
jgi:hypothetical protein